MLSDHYADQIGYYTKDNNPIKEHFQLEYKNDWQLRYMNFLENRSNQDFVILLPNKIKQFISEYLIVLQQRKKTMSTGMNLQTSFQNLAKLSSCPQHQYIIDLKITI